MKHITSFNTIIAGCIYFETIINKNKQLYINKPGGNVLYAAAGFHIWGNKAGLTAKISENNSTEWISEFSNFHFDLAGIKKTKCDFEQRKFFAVSESNTVINDNPKKYFYELNLPFPKSLLGLEPSRYFLDKRNTPAPYSIHPDDFPHDYLQTNNLLLCPIDFYSHSLIPPFYRSQTNGNVIFCASNGYMHPSFFFDIPALVRGCSTFIASIKQIRNLFKGKSDDIWEMAEYIAQSGVEVVVIVNGIGPHYLFDVSAKKKYMIPISTTNVIDPVGSFAVFCGGFGAGFTTHFNPLRAALMGSVSTSLKVEGSTPLHTFQTLPDLAYARIESISDSVIIA